MGDKITFDYFYGGQEETFSYYRIPRVLFTGQQFKGLSIGAKMLYGLLLDRMYLSSRNGWYDDQGRVYIYYPVEEIEETMGCGHNKAVRLLAELDEVKGIGLIERIRQGLGKPAKIYVKQFTTRAVPDTPRGPAPDSTPQPTGFNRDRQDVSKKDLQGYHNRTSRLLETGRADVPKADGNYKNKNYPYDSYVIAKPRGKDGPSVDIISNDRYAAKLNALYQSMGYPLPEKESGREENAKKAGPRAPQERSSPERGSGLRTTARTSEAAPEGKPSVRARLAALHAAAKGLEPVEPLRDRNKELLTR